MIAAILVIMGAFALITQLIGVHTVLGAFVAGILVGQSPILTEEIDGSFVASSRRCSCRCSSASPA